MFSNLKSQLERFFHDTYILPTLLVILLGIGARLWHLFGQRSFWVDEVWIAENIINRTSLDLFLSLDNDQVAPIGWLLLVKLLENATPNIEISLRLVPFFFAIIGIFAAARFFALIDFFSKAEKFFAVSLVALLPILVYYAADLKQYTTDVAASAILLAIFIEFLNEKTVSKRFLFILGVAGFLSILLTLSAPFVLFSISLAIMLRCFNLRDWHGLTAIALLSLAWLLTTLGLYLVFYQGTASLSGMQTKWWAWRFAPFPPTTMADIKWYYGTFFKAFSFLFGGINAEAQHRYSDIIGGFSAFLFILGLIHIRRKNLYLFIVVTTPILAVLVSSMFGLYAFFGRLILFLAPQIIVCVVAGAYFLIRRFSDNKFVVYFSIFLFFLIPFDGLLKSSVMKPPFAHANISPVLNYLKSRVKTGDTIYVNYLALPQFRFYLSCFDFRSVEIVQGRAGWSYFSDDLQTLSMRPRVWMVFVRVKEVKFGFNQVTMAKNLASSLGAQVASVRFSDAAILFARFQKNEEGKVRKMFPKPVIPYIPAHPGYAIRGSQIQKVGGGVLTGSRSKLGACRALPESQPKVSLLK